MQSNPTKLSVINSDDSNSNPTQNDTQCGKGDPHSGNHCKSSTVAPNVCTCNIKAAGVENHPTSLQISEDTGSLTNEWLTTESAAEYLKISPATLRNMTSNGKVPYHKLGRRNRYRLTDLRRLLLENQRGAKS
jgi:excisionase family DNA binding protein